jgi:hypothetical protein
MSPPQPATAIVTLTITALMGCGSAPDPAYPAATTAPEPTAPEPTAPAPTAAPSLPAPATTQPASAPARPAACSTATGPVLLAPALDLACKHPDRFSPGSCQGETTITLLNCGRAPITLERIILRELGRKPGMTITYDGSQHGGQIAPGSAWTHTYQDMRARRFTVVAQLSAPAVAPPPATLVVRNPMLEAARTRCKAAPCNGDFVTRGMLQILACSCRMPDAGKPCTDGDQCHGKCISTPKQGYRCSRYKTVFGCHNYLPRGWSRQKPPAKGLRRRVPSICVD